jgi:hypothetical protein
MARKLAVVPPDARPEEKPSSIKAAVDISERALLVMMRGHLATQLDSGAVPAHALAGVMAKLREYDRDIRAIDARAEEEPSGDEDPVEDGEFDSSAV